MRNLGVLMLLVGSVLVAGCGQNVDQARPATPGADVGTKNPVVAVATENAEAAQIPYQGWDGLRLLNGLATIVVVPDIGGRVMEYKLGPHPFLWTNPDEAGRIYPAPQTEDQRKWHSFGGYKVWPAPQSKWGGPPDPLKSELDGGVWQSEVKASSAQVAEVQLTSPEDREVTGLQLERLVRLFAGGSHVQMVETFRNVTDQPIEWSIWDVTQVPGSLDAEAAFSPEARIYFPLNPESKSPQGYWPLIDQPSDQWEVLPQEGLLRVTYQRQLGKIGADSVGGWIAYADEKHHLVFVKRFEVGKLESYPDDGATVEVFTSDTAPYMEVEVLSPLKRLEPRQRFSFTVDWYAATVPGPILATSDVGAVNRPLALETKDGQTKVTGTFGVFVQGKARLVALNGAAKALATLLETDVTPMQALELAQTVTLPPDTVELALAVDNANGAAMGRLATLSLRKTPPPGELGEPAAWAPGDRPILPEQNQ